jgi:serine/threonine protein kinase
VSDSLERIRTALADRYAIERLLGQGGMALVYLARDQLRVRKVSHILPVADGFLNCPSTSTSVARTTPTGFSLLALAVASGSVGGTIRNFSPHEVVFPGSVNLSFVAQPVNGASGDLLMGADGSALAVKATGANGTPWEGVQVQLAALKNNGSFVAVCNDMAETDEAGIATFSGAILNKAGGYRIVAHTVASTTDPDVTSFQADSVTSTLFNMKNGNAPISCP